MIFNRGARSLRANLLGSASAAIAITAAIGLSGAADALVVRDDVGLDGAFDSANQWGSVVQLFLLDNATGNIFFNCTGTLVNARTIMTASHCVFDAPMEAYGTYQSGAQYTMLVGFGPDTENGLFTFAGTGASYAEGGVAQSSQVIIHPSVDFDTPGFLDFPYGDVTMIALDEPIRDVTPMGMLLSPLRTLTHVVQAGYGTFGTGSTGEQGIGFRRLVGENMLGLIGSNADYIDGVFPAFAPSGEIGVETQTLYWTDFDSPDRTPADSADCVFTGVDIQCNTIEGVFAIDYFGGDALPGEAATAPGDSGGPLIADQIHSSPLLTAVLSGGYDFFGLGTTYGDVSFYNPLFAFQQFITQNNPYKYVAAKSGDGDWFDPAHWVQTLDPGYFVYDSAGNIVNGVPDGSEDGVYTTSPTVGSVLGQPAVPGANPPSFLLPQPGTPGFGGNLPISSVFLGPGSTGFVPNNTNGIRGVAFQNPALYFDVTLANPGTTTLHGGESVTIDRLTIADTGAVLNLEPNSTFASLIDTRITAGELRVNGTFSTPEIMAFGGLVSGSGSLSLDPDGLFGTASKTLFLGAATLSPGSATSVGTLTVSGNVQFSSGSTFLVTLGAGGSDLLKVNATDFDPFGYGPTNGAVDAVNASLRINLAGSFIPTYGSTYTVIETPHSDLIGGSGLTGNFITNGADLPGVLTTTYSVVHSDSSAAFCCDLGVLTVTVVPFAGAVAYTSDEQRVVANALDAIRAQGGYPALANLFNSLDPTSESLLPLTFEAMSPLNALAATGIAEAGGRQTMKSVADRAGQLVGGGGRGFDMAGLQMLGLGPRLASADPYDAMMMGAAAVAAANEEAARIGQFQLKEGWGGFLNVSTLVDSSLLVTDFAGEVDLNSTGGTLGLDYTFANQGFVGASLSYFASDTDDILGIQSADVDSYGVTLYGGARSGDGAFLTGQAGYSSQSYDLARFVPLLLGDQTLTADPDGSAWTFAAKGGYDFQTEFGAVTPFIGLDAVAVHLDGYTEAGGSAALSFEERDVTQIDGRIGLAYKGAFEVGGGTLRPRLSIAYAADLKNGDNDDVLAAFDGFNGVQMIFTETERDSGWAEYDVGIEYEAEAWGVALSYHGADNGQIDQSAVSGRVSVAW